MELLQKADCYSTNQKLNIRNECFMILEVFGYRIKIKNPKSNDLGCVELF